MTFSEVVSLAEPVDLAWRDGDPGALRRRAGRDDRPPRRGRAGDGARHHRPHRGRRRAGSARPGVRPRRRPGVRQLHRQPGTRSSPSTRWSPTARSARRRVPCAAGDRAAVRQPQRWRPDVRAGRDAVHRHGRRRLGRRSRAAGHGPRARCSASCCASTRPWPTARRTPSRPTTRSSARRARRRRSGRAVCATHGASRSTGRPVTCGSPTSARTPSRRSTSPRPAAASTPARG